MLIFYTLPYKGNTELSQLNPRSHKGNDGVKPLFYCNDWFVSIHVPTRGTTESLFDRYQSISPFQSTFPQGERPLVGSFFSWTSSFQSTFPQGERLQGGAIVPPFSGFNPRSHKGNDLCMLELLLVGYQFQSTFPQGERQQFYPNFLIFYCYKSTIFSIPTLSAPFSSFFLLFFSPILCKFLSANPPGILCVLPIRTQL